MTDGVIAFSLPARLITSVSPGAAALFGYGTATMSGRPLDDLLSISSTLAQALMVGCCDGSYLLKGRHQGGAEISIEASFTTVVLAGEICCVVVVRAATPPASGAADLQLKWAELRGLFDGLDDALALLDAQGVVLAANQALARVLAVEAASQLEGRLWQEVWCAIGHQPAAEWIVEALRDGQPHQERVRLQHPGRQARILQVHVIPQRVADGPITRGIVRLVDVSEQVQHAALALDSERFAASGRVAAALAHEINTPLQSVQAFLYLIPTAPPEQREHYLTLVQHEIDRVGQIIKQLLDVYRPDTSNPVPVDINGLIRQVLLLIDHICAIHRVNVRSVLADRLPPVWGHARQLVQVVLNLLVNAVQATSSGGEVTIATSLQPASGAPGQHQRDAVPTVVIQVQDSGQGIAEQDLAKIFDPFYSTKADGVGLGLAVCAQIVREHGGQIDVVSRLHAGSTFTILFPLWEEHGEEPF